MRIDVETFECGTDKEAALKPLEEAAEAYAEWQILPYGPDGPEATDWLADELADCVQACCNLAARYGIDMDAAMRRCEERNRERGRYEWASPTS